MRCTTIHLPARQAFKILTKIPASNALKTTSDWSLRLFGERAPEYFNNYYLLEP